MNQIHSNGIILAKVVLGDHAVIVFGLFVFHSLKSSVSELWNFRGCSASKSLLLPFDSYNLPFKIKNSKLVPFYIIFLF